MNIGCIMNILLFSSVNIASIGAPRPQLAESTDCLKEKNIFHKILAQSLNDLYNKSVFFF